MIKTFFVVGPTASGKTEYAVRLAEDIGGEIVSADSMQIYKYMDIGSAKPSAEELSVQGRAARTGSYGGRIPNACAP